MMKIAVIGTGIAGNIAAYKLRQTHDITVFEAGAYIGGHTNTVDVEEAGRILPIDTGFIVFNDRTYPNFNKVLDEIGQSWQNSVMSFSVQSERDGLEYNGATINTLFCQRRNFLRPAFHRMVRDILRFNREALAALDSEPFLESVGTYLRRKDYSQEFLDWYLLPMAAAIWSAEPVAIKDMPLRFLVRFFDNHGLLQLKDRPVWRVIRGGSREYVKKLVAGHRDRIFLDTPVAKLHRDGDSVEVVTAAGDRQRFDAVFVACHSDQALQMLVEPTRAEIDTLSAIEYQDNEAVLHTDATLMPRNKRAWAA
ncbi:MAG: FAD-dependent oxidoreductase, partial [Gammaproteobacteria bacterium]|nr:FAD-dependent oxidoreductase [Gammaproteobacteria bacterium]